MSDEEQKTQKNIGHLRPIINMADKVVCKCVCGKKVEIVKDPEKHHAHMSCGCVKRTDTQLLKVLYRMEKIMKKIQKKEEKDDK